MFGKYPLIKMGKMPNILLLFIDLSAIMKMAGNFCLLPVFGRERMLFEESGVCK
jgi:hypothetical protein